MRWFLRKAWERKGEIPRAVIEIAGTAILIAYFWTRDNIKALVTGKPFHERPKLPNSNMGPGRYRIDTADLDGQ